MTLPAVTLDDAVRENLAALAAGDTGLTACGPELDGLAHDAIDSALKAANLAAMRRVCPTRTVAAVVIAKNEGCYLLECIAHYRATGFEHVFIYTNDNTDGSDALLAALAQTGFVTVIANPVGPETPPQLKAYEHAVQLLRPLRDFRWVSFFDVDEFLVPAERHGHSVIETLAALEQAGPDPMPAAIYWNWKWFGSQDAVRHAPGLVMERFNHANPHPLGKSLVRLAAIDSMRPVHIPAPLGLPLVDAAFRPIEPAANFFSGPPEGELGWLHHYYSKSFEEFGLKAARGRPASPGGREGKALQTFFDWDVPIWHVTAHPVPAGLLARVRTELAALLAVPAIRTAAEAAEAAQRALSMRLHGGMLDAQYAAARARFRPPRSPAG